SPRTHRAIWIASPIGCISSNMTARFATLIPRCLSKMTLTLASIAVSCCAVSAATRRPLPILTESRRSRETGRSKSTGLPATRGLAIWMPRSPTANACRRTIADRGPMGRSAGRKARSSKRFTASPSRLRCRSMRKGSPSDTGKPMRRAPKTSEIEWRQYHELLHTHPEQYLRIADDTIRQYPDDPRGYLDCVTYWMDLEDYDCALCDIDSALALRENTMTRYRRGVVLRCLG